MQPLHALHVLREQCHPTATTLTIETTLAEIIAELRGQDIFIKMPDYHKLTTRVILTDILSLLSLDSDQIMQEPAIIEIIFDRTRR